MGSDPQASVLAAFRACFAADLKSGRPRSVAFYARMFPGFDEAVAAEYARLDGEHAAKDTSPTEPEPPSIEPLSLESPSIEAPADTPPPRDETETIGPYRVIRELGRGAQGTVLLAQDTRVDRKVALKVLAPAYASSPHMLRRFRREAGAASKLDHPGICTVYDADVDGRTPWIAMRFVHGRTLAQTLADAKPKGAPTGSSQVRSTIVPLPAGAPTDSDPDAPGAGSDARPSLARLLLFFEEVARALHAAHEAGLVHRDVKPGNVMVTDECRPVVLDFGLAQEDEEGEGGRLTETGTLMGTPAYMSPEQLLAQRVALDRRTDVYSLGVALFECLTLRLPFDAPTREGLYQQILATEPPKLRRVNHLLPRDLEVVVETAMAKDRARRYQTAADFAEDLRRVRLSEPIRARPASALNRLMRWARRKPGLATSLAAIFVLLAGGLAETTLLLRKAHDALGVADVANRAADAARRQAEDALGDVTRERDLKNTELQRSRAQNLVHEATAVRDADPTLSLLLAREALKTMPLPQAIGAIHDVLAHSLLVAELRGHRGRVNAAAFSGDGALVVTAGGDGTARVFGVDGKERAVLSGHADIVCTASFSPTGARIVTASFDRTARVWNPRGAEIASLPHDDVVLDARFSPSGDRIVTACADGKARIWDGEGRATAVMTGHDGPVEAATFSPKGDLIATASDDGTARLWDAQGHGTAVLRGHTGRVLSVAFSPAGDRILTCSSDGTARLWDASGAAIATLAPMRLKRTLAVTSAAFAPSSDFVVVTTNQSLVRFDKDGKEAGTLGPTETDLTGAVTSPNGEQVLTFSAADRAARLWTADGHELASFRGHDGAIVGARFSPDGSRVLTWAADGTARIWRYPPHERAIVRVSPHETGAVDVSPAGLLVCDSRDGVVVVRDLEGREKFKLAPPEGCRSPRFTGGRICTLGVSGGPTVWSVEGAKQFPLDRVEGAVSVDVARNGLGAVATQGYVVLWKWTSGQIERSTEFSVPGGARVHGAFFTPAGDALLVPLADGTIRLFDTQGQETLTLRGHQGAVLRVEASPAGDHAVSISNDRTTRIWNLSTGEEIAAIPGAGTAKFSPKGDRIVTTAEDRVARVFDLAGHEVFSLPHDSRVTGAAYSPSGDEIYTLASDGFIRTWFAHEDDVVRAADDPGLRSFTSDERRRYADLLDAESPGVVAMRARVDEIIDGIVDARGTVDEAVERVRADASIPEDLRAAALDMVSRRLDAPDTLNGHAWELVVAPNGSAESYGRGLKLVTAAVRMAPSNGLILNTLGVAQYRAGDYPAAARTLARSDWLNGRTEPADAAFLAMALARLGKADDANRELTRLREMLKTSQRAQQPDTKAMLAEAAETVEGKAPAAKPTGDGR